MGAVQRLATVVIVGLVALATVLVLYVADESNRIDATALQQRDDGIARATTNFVSLCMTCHGPAGMGYTGPDAKDANGNQTSRIGAALGGVNEVLNHTGSNDKGTPWPGATQFGVVYPGGFAGRTAWITNRITNGLPTADGKGYIMPAFSEAKGGPLNDAQIEELVWMIQYGDWNKIYNQAIATSGGYPTPGPGPSTLTPAAVVTTAPAAGGSTEPTYEIDTVDIAFSKTALTIPAGVEVTLNIVNKGASVHTFDIDALNIHSGDIQPGTTFSTKIKAAAGDYTYYCAIPGHEAAGMKGTITADPNAPVPTSAAAASPAAGAAASPAASTPEAAGPAPLALDLEDIKFSTDALSAPANTATVIHITNKGAIVHNFNIDALNLHSGDVQPGASIDVTVNAAAGSYTYYCDIPGHEAAGMKGTLTVSAGAPTGAGSPAAGATPGAATPPAAGAAPLAVDLEDIKFSTDALSAPANTATVIHITNNGATVHNFNIDALNLHSGDVQPGASIDVTVNAAAGSYTYYCNIPGHEAAGMKGTLTVSAGAPSGAGSPAAGATPGAATPPAAGATPLAVDLEDIKFSTNTLQAQADTPTTIKITNTGASVHNFSITELKVNTGDVQPGQSVEVTINAPAGTYTYFCDVPGHEAAGMKGTLTVSAGPPPPVGGAATPPAAAATAPPANAAGQVVNLDMVDINFDPKTLEIPANTDVTIHITNKGVTAHDFSIDELKIVTGDVAPGATIDVKVNAPAGTYKYYCNVPGHEAAGMVGELTVSGGSPAPAAGTPAAAAGAAPLTLDLEDIKFSSNTLQVQADTPTVIKITNQGATTHNFSIDALKINTGDIQPGQTVEVTINAPAGTYTYYCNVPGHEAAGMKGTLTVAGGSPPPAAGAATPPAATTAPPAAAAGQVVNLDMVDINFDPKTLEIPANTDVTIHITNKGVTAHDFSIDELKISTGEVAPGATIDVKINAPAGTYKYFCNVPGHEAAGMVGELTVK